MSSSAVSSSSSARSSIYVWSKGNGSGALPPGLEPLRTAETLLLVVFPEAGGIAKRFVDNILRVHRAPEHRRWPQVLLVVDDDDADPVSWERLSAQLPFDYLIIAQYLTYSEYMRFKKADVTRLVKRFQRLRENATKLEVALSQKELILAAHSANHNIKTSKDMVNDSLQQLTQDCKYFVAGNVFAVNDEILPFTCKLDVGSLPKKIADECKTAWPRLVKRNQVNEEIADDPDITIKVVDASFKLPEALDEFGFLYYLFLVGAPVAAGVDERIRRACFEVRTPFDIISCLPSASNHEAALECALRNAKDGLKALRLIDVVDDATHLQNITEAAVDQAIDDSLFEIKQAKAAD